MPCQDPETTYPDYKDREYFVGKCNELTRLLCDTCRFLQDNNELFPTSELLTWWVEHKNSEGHIK